RIATVVLSILPIINAAAVEPAPGNYTFVENSNTDTVVLQELLDKLSGICGMRVKPMRNAFHTKAEGFQESYIGRICVTGDCEYVEAIKKRDGKVSMVGYYDAPIHLLDVRKSKYMFEFNKFKASETVFSKNGCENVPVLVYNCKSQMSTEKIFATVGTHQGNSRKLKFVNEHGMVDTVGEHPTANNGYQYLELEIVDVANATSVKGFSCYVMLYIMCMLMIFVQ
ncbi:hypothetical protein PFISCL1PPCAC_26939, partial [Pristionchus fissidentatus]